MHVDAGHRGPICSRQARRLTSPPWRSSRSGLQRVDSSSQFPGGEGRSSFRISTSLRSCLFSASSWRMRCCLWVSGLPRQRRKLPFHQLAPASASQRSRRASCRGTHRRRSGLALESSAPLAVRTRLLTPFVVFWSSFPCRRRPPFTVSVEIRRAHFHARLPQKRRRDGAWSPQLHTTSVFVPALAACTAAGLREAQSRIPYACVFATILKKAHDKDLCATDA